MICSYKLLRKRKKEVWIRRMDLRPGEIGISSGEEVKREGKEYYYRKIGGKKWGYCCDCDGCITIEVKVMR